MKDINKMIPKPDVAQPAFDYIRCPLHRYTFFVYSIVSSSKISSLA